MLIVSLQASYTGAQLLPVEKSVAAHRPGVQLHSRRHIDAALLLTSGPLDQYFILFKIKVFLKLLNCHETLL